MKKILKNSGFTLIELIIVVAIIALLAAASLVAINPGKRVGDANNAKRWSDITAIADAYSAYLVDNGGTHPTTTAFTNGVTYSITSTTVAHAERCAADTTNGNATTTTANVNLSNLVTSGYIGAIPSDPGYVAADTYNTGYYLYKESSGKLVIGSCDAYNSANIEVVR
jgi:prepilin-type N-terminal cleavage/methylation domain-containing protein